MGDTGAKDRLYFRVLRRLFAAFCPLFLFIVAQEVSLRQPVIRNGAVGDSWQKSSFLICVKVSRRTPKSAANTTA